MYKIVVNEFGGTDKLEIVECELPEPTGTQVRVRVTSIGMNHAELMSRAGNYKIASGDPPFTPGLEAGGIIDAIGPEVERVHVGDRVILGVDAPRLALGGEGTYQSHYLTDQSRVVAAPDNLADEQLGIWWLAYLTAWGCLVWKQNLRAGQNVLLPAASSAVAIAAAQIVRNLGATAIGTTTSPDKVDALQAMDEAPYDHIVVTRDRKWWNDVKQITGDQRCDVIFDPVGGGNFLNSEIRLLGMGGTLWVYGLLGEVGPVDVTPLIRLRGAIRGWALTELAATGGTPLQQGYQHVTERIASGEYRMPIAQTFSLRDVREAHEQMEQARHIGKLVLIP